MTGCIKRSISVLLCLVMLTAMLVAIIPESTVQVSALTYRTGANGAHSSYMGSKFYKNFQKLELTGDGRTDVLAVALSQLGYQESPTAYDFDGIGGGSGNYTEYCYNMGDFGYGYGGGSYAWCATFVSWALYQSRCTDQGSMSDWTRNHSGDSKYIWREVGCAMWANQLRTCGYFQRSKAYNGNTYQPQSGDLIFFCWEGPSGGEDHIGLVVYSDSSYVYTIEGNTSNQNGLNADGGGVYFKKYALDYYYITGYGVLPYKTNSAVKKIDYSGANPTPGYYVCNASKYIYATETATDVSYYSERFSMFEVVGVASNGRLKVKGISTTTGAVVDGYILNNDDRVIQLSCSASTPRDELYTSITAAKGVRYDYYTEANLATLRSAYTEACTIYNDSNSSDTQLTAAKQKLDKALANTVASAENVVSKGKSYTTTESGRTDIYVDDGKRLTDGVKGNTDGGNNMFSGYNSNDTIEVVLDMGGNVSTNTYRIYAAKMESWGITAPAKLAVSVSNDGVNFTDVSYTTVRYRTSGTTDTWNMFTYTVKTNTTRTERYIKFTVTSGGNHVWLEEVEAMNNPIAASGRVYVTGVNKYITAGDTVIFTPDQGEINVTNFNISYTTNVIATWNGANYVVSSVTTGTGTDTPAITLNSNQILVACHEWESGTDDPILGSRANSATVKNLKVGDVLTLTNVDVANKALAVAPTIEVKTTSSTPVEKPADAEVFWVTHINDHNSEGAGAIFTSTYEGAVWWLHVAFAPTGTAGVYKITAISDGIPDGSGTALAIPNGGFVYAINKGNNYIELGIGDTDFTSPNCDAAIAQAQTWKVGDEFKFYGIDPLNPIVSTSTPAVAWYDDSYVCTSYFEIIDDDEPIVTPPVVEPDDVVLGDVNLDGKIDQYDYILVKRHYFETRILVGDEFKRGDVNVDGVVDQYDYILIARHYFGTFVIAQK